MTIDLIPNQRPLFDMPEDVAYLNTGYMSPLAVPVMAAGQQGMAAKGQPWRITSQDFFTGSEEIRGKFARLIGAGADCVTLVPSVSYLMGIAARALPLTAGQSILVLAEQFPSNYYVWSEKAAAAGAQVVVVPRPADDDWTAAVLERIGSGTAIVALPHCHWTDGGLLDLVSIGARCRAVGAALCLDVTQSLGALPLDVAAVDPDFMVAAGYKWLLGPYSYSFGYVAPRWHHAAPLEAGWLTRLGAEDFTRLADYQPELQPGARRFDVGERSNFALTPAAAAALDLLLGWGVESIAATLKHRNDRLAARAAADLGLTSAPPDRRAGHFIGLRFPSEVPTGLTARLAAKKIYVSVRGRSMRVTPHLWTNDADIERFFAAMGRLMG